MRSPRSTPASPSISPIPPRFVAVRFAEPAGLGARQSFAEHRDLLPFRARLELPGEKFTLFRWKDPLALKPAGALTRKLAELAHDPQVERIAPIRAAGLTHVFSPGRILVGATAGHADLRELVSRHNGHILRDLGGTFLIELPASAEPEMVCRELLNHPDIVRFAEPDVVTLQTFESKRAPALPDAGDGGQDISKLLDLAPVWGRFGRGVPRVGIAILDDGVDAHPALRLALRLGVDVTNAAAMTKPWVMNAAEFHGTACAGLAAALPSTGFTGVAPGCAIIPYRIAQRLKLGDGVVPGNGPADPREEQGTFSVLSNLIWAIGLAAGDPGVAVINISSNNHGAPSAALASVIRTALNRSDRPPVLIVASTGDAADGGIDPNAVLEPAGIEGVIGVAGAAWRRNDDGSGEWVVKRADDGLDVNQWGARFDGASIMAPAVHLRTTDPRGANGLVTGDFETDFNGTSAAAPVVAGALALLMSQFPLISRERVRKALLTGATSGRAGEPPMLNVRVAANALAGGG